MSDSTGFLGVERSALGRRWYARLDDDRMALGLAQRLGLPEIVARVIAGRGVDEAAAPAFFAPRLREQLPDPTHLKDMDRATARLARAIRTGEQVAIFGDYDVDGATSSALLHRFVSAAGGRVRIYIPDRQREGYGPNAPALLRLKSEGVGLVVTVDCGVTAHAPLAAAADAGLDVIVVDHHVAEPRLPLAIGVVNPNRLDETTPHRQLAAVGVSFLLAVAVNRVLREEGWFATRPEPSLLELLDLVALGTVCDVVPLTGLNRAFVAQGLKVLGQRRNVGLVALADVARIDRACDVYHLGFVLGPRVNAGGRVGEADLGARLLTTNDPDEARALAERLDRHNLERQAIEAAVLEAATAQVDSAAASGNLVFAAGEGWHPGVIGIVAGRLRERYDRPTFVAAMADGIAKGSGRAALGVDLGAAIIAAREAGLLINGGGHKNAAGFTAAVERLGELREFLGQRIAAQITRTQSGLAFDGALSLGAATPDLIAALGKVGPFGVGNPEPRFAFPAVRVAKADIVGERHVRCFLADARGGRLSGIAFRAVGSPLGDVLLDRAGVSLHLGGRLRADDWRGETRIQLQIEDAAAAGGAAAV
ncbi:MAG TPA: single-stranded-DNA-specific exonuclease RecJ [Alphaproteobacteria bacterium]|nr:single-stranded-DNA-specific exonuclease RecJ [Alphaproteobacteria bacterium]